MSATTAAPRLSSDRTASRSATGSVSRPGGDRGLPRPTARAGSGRSYAAGSGARIDADRPRLRIVVDGGQQVVTRVTPRPAASPAASPIVSAALIPAPSPAFGPEADGRCRVDLTEFFAAEPGGETQRLTITPPARLTRRGRVVVATLALGAVLGLGVLWASGSAAGDHPLRTTTVTVHSGDTLWDVASRATSGTDVDVRTMVARIVSLNHLDSSSVQAGLRLRVPTS